MRTLTETKLLEGQTEEITISELRSKPGEVFQQVQMGKEFTVSKSGRVIAEIKAPSVFDWGALSMLRAGAAYILMLALTSCGTYTKVSSTGDVTIQQGLASSIQQSAVSVTPNGPGKYPTVTAVQTGYDGTSVINNSIATLVPISLAKYGFKTKDSNNAASVANNKTAAAPGIIKAKGDAAVNLTNAQNAPQLAKIAKAPVPTTTP